MRSGGEVCYLRLPCRLVVVQLNASDSDEGENARLRYELVDDSAAAAATDGDDDDDDDEVVDALPLFAVDEDTGVVTAVASLDRETSPQHRFQAGRTYLKKKKKQERLAVASIAQDDPSTLPGDDPFPRARMRRDRNAR